MFFGSARFSSREHADAELESLTRRLAGRDAPESEQHLALGRKAVEWSRYYEEARELAKLLTEWSLALGLAAPSFRRHIRRRPGHHGGGESRRAGGGWQDDRPQHQAAVRAGAESATSPTASISSSTTSSCGSSGLPTWRRRSSFSRAASARSTRCSRFSR